MFGRRKAAVPERAPTDIETVRDYFGRLVGTTVRGSPHMSMDGFIHEGLRLCDELEALRTEREKGSGEG
jgi:hypothetical protein